MTLDEAIAHAREVASEQKRRSGACVQNDSECDKFSTCLKCAEEHEQLAEWLEELKILRMEKSEFPIIAKDNYEKNSLEEAVLDYCISTGPIHSVSLTENNDAIEIWIEYENEVYVFYLFDYERGVINFN